MNKQLALLACATIALTARLGWAEQQTQPNIVFLVGDDLGCDLGCYGNDQVRTPNLDRLAREGARWTRMFANSPVCAPARAALFTGQHPIHLGTMHMRSRLANPPDTLTQLLRQSGYFVVWPNKIDFNFDPPDSFRDSKEHWIQGPLPKEPFFAYLNLGEPHESVLMEEKLQSDFYRELEPGDRTDPAAVRIPPYLPDDPEIRRSIALHYDMISSMDKRVGRILELLEKQGVAERTIVVFVGDHGWPFPRGKRWLYDSGLRVPFLVRWPGVIAPGTVDEGLASFIDVAPTLLQAAGLPSNQGMTGRILFGPSKQVPPSYVFASRDRMDEVEDRSRAVRDARYKYIRNYRPKVAYSTLQAYAEGTPAMKALRRLHAEGKLEGVPLSWFAPAKPTEELYDTEADPQEIRNLAGDPAAGEVLVRMRGALDDWIAAGDLGAVPESKLLEDGTLIPMKVK